MELFKDMLEFDRKQDEYKLAEIASLSAENERLRAALEEIAKDPRDDGVCVGDGWDFYTDVVNYAKESLK